MTFTKIAPRYRPTKKIYKNSLTAFTVPQSDQGTAKYGRCREMNESQDSCTMTVYSRSPSDTTGSSETNQNMTNGNIFKNNESFRRESLDNTTRRNPAVHALIPEEPLEIQCGEKTALLFVSKLCQGSKGPCILYGNEWLTPNELQYICGRETAKDWKRSIRHKGKSLKSLIGQGFLKVHPPICDCPGCRVSSPVVSFLLYPILTQFSKYPCAFTKA